LKKIDEYIQYFISLFLKVITRFNYRFSNRLNIVLLNNVNFIKKSVNLPYKKSLLFSCLVHRQKRLPYKKSLLFLYPVHRQIYLPYKKSLLISGLAHRQICLPYKKSLLFSCLVHCVILLLSNIFTPFFHEIIRKHDLYNYVFDKEKHLLFLKTRSLK
jgi:hypothetical protein